LRAAELEPNPLFVSILESTFADGVVVSAVKLTKADVSFPP
jgi:hypothetical protein